LPTPAILELARVRWASITRWLVHQAFAYWIREISTERWGLDRIGQKFLASVFAKSHQPSSTS
jgi:hypothetical protein